MSSYQYRKSHCGDKTILRPSYLHNGISYTGKMTSLYWIGALIPSERMRHVLLCMIWFDCVSANNAFNHRTQTRARYGSIHDTSVLPCKAVTTSLCAKLKAPSMEPQGPVNSYHIWTMHIILVYRYISFKIRTPIERICPNLPLEHWAQLDSMDFLCIIFASH